MTRYISVPAAWMKVDVIGPYRVEPQVNARWYNGGKVSRSDLFYRVTRDGRIVSDHGDRRGARLAASDYFRTGKED